MGTRQTDLEALARDTVKAPAILLMAVAGLGGLLQLAAVAINVMFGDRVRVGGLTIKLLGTEVALAGGVLGIIAVVVAGVILYGARCMMRLESYRLAAAASVAALIPFISPCCLLGLPAGIWALIVLNRADVKAAFRT